MSEEPKLKFAKITRPDTGGGGYIVSLTLKEIHDAFYNEMFDGNTADMQTYLDVGDKFMVEVIEMTQVERDALPEFDGW